jgi:preprotein translocase subunit SecD
MFAIVAIVLAIGWVLGFALMKVSSVFIHIFLALALVSAILHFIRRNSKAETRPHS